MSFQKILLEKTGQKIYDLSLFPNFQYPNIGHEHLTRLFPKNKVRIFGYGSLINKTSAKRNLKQEAVDSMQPVIAFGLKRIFNYKAKTTTQWNEDQHLKEKAMLNLIPVTSYGSIINGVIFDVDEEDLTSLVNREVGYDLVPILVASWNEAIEENPEIEIQVAYAFLAYNELRNHVSYTSTRYYPVRGYLQAIVNASEDFGQQYRCMWNRTTYLADGVTAVHKWDKESFEGTLCSEEP